MSDHPGRMKIDEKTNSEEDNSSKEIPITIDEGSSASVSFLQLWKYATKGEIILNIIGLICASGAGAIQPSLAIMFGNLVNEMNNFYNFVPTYRDDPTNQANIDEFNDRKSTFKSGVNYNCLMLLVIAICMFVATYGYFYIFTYTSERISRRLRLLYLRSVLRQDIAFFDKIGAGEIATRIETDMNLIQSGISEKVALACMFLSSFIVAFIIAFSVQARIAGVLFIVVPCIAIAMVVIITFITKFEENALKSIGDSGNLAEESISTIRTAKAFGLQLNLSLLYDNFLYKARKEGFKNAYMTSIGFASFDFMAYSTYSLAFVWGVTLLLKGQTDIGSIIKVVEAIIVGAFGLGLVAPQLQIIAKGQAAAAKIYETIERIPPIDSASEDGLKPSSIDGNITFKDVNFAYPARPEIQVMKNFSTKFSQGKFTALVGASGSGKSTSIGLIERFYDPSSGLIELDGTNIRDLNVKWLRSKIGLVGQEPVLFNDTIRANVEHGLIGTEMEHWSDDQKLELVTKACKTANADSFIDDLPEGYNNTVGERGMLLSGGQKQRVAIARAIVSDPPILLLDEATAALDSASESIVQKALDQAAMNRTTVAIAHRLSTIKNADQIIVMDHGEILEIGDHNSLTAKSDGAYSQLVSAQQLSNHLEVDNIEADTDDQSIHDMASVKDSVRSPGSEILNVMEDVDNSKKYSWGYLLKSLIKLNRNSWPLYMFGSIAAMVSAAGFPCFGIVFGLIMQDLSLKSVDDADYHSYMRQTTDRDSLWFFIIALGIGIALVIQNYCMQKSGEKLTFNLRHESFKKLLRSDVEYFDKKENNTGVLCSGLADNARKVQGLAGLSSGSVMQCLWTVIIGVAVALGYSWKLGLVGTACIPLTFAAGLTELKVVTLKDKYNRKAYEESANMACEASGAIRTVAALTREDSVLAYYDNLLLKPYTTSIKSGVWRSAAYALGQALSFGCIALVFYVGALWLMDLSMDLQSFYVTLESVIFSTILASRVFTYVPDISSARGGATRILRLLERVDKIEVEHDNQDGKQLETVEGHITFENVHFRYPTRSDVPVLRSLDLEIKPGSYVALVGPSGCGKSTTIQLIERFYDAICGSVKLDGHEVRELNLNNLRSHMALVSQEPTLYGGTIKYNIMMGAVKPHEEVSQQELEDACADANILDFIKGLPDGFETQVGGKGTQLSGGQKQRIAIARALIRKPKILLLDEATSALDQTSEAVVQAALDKVASGRTTIAIAHRLSTIQKADRIYVFKDGKVSQAGTHQELIEEKGGLYAELVALQSLSKND
ncbi:P-loop containing nucleoside triphosphate hydrolase protein [Wallemia mellicola]|uniref:P-loop containing nucleoside triphosphate hydrolase protein n=1 Tax=Wallemia mellicola TaxID=1708541 RepID=A0A4T0PDC9_9BASI|nr:P-loop containing nucleoside triphosphate hydrolase protein [Wallemia mellicola]TIC08546.1 P-loop containing nucleoside triphosphate hydrolase protein [Wallemia mellicola]